MERFRAQQDLRGTRLADAIARIDRKLIRLTRRHFFQAVHNQAEPDLANDASD
jgi:hypothetical protein